VAVTESRPRPRELPDWMIAHGHTAATTPHVADWLSIPPGQVRMAMARLSRDRRMFSPARGLWIPIPPQYRTWGAPPAIEFVDDLMNHLGRDYYVGWLSAAELHGVAHQHPQVFQVAVDAPAADRSAGRVRLRFLTRARAGDLPTEGRPTTGGTARVATPELVALDLADDPDAGGGLNNVATVLAELAEEPGLDPDRLVRLAAEFPAATGRRLGWLLDYTDATGDRSPLLEHLRARAEHTPARLSPRRPRRGGVDARWGVWLNADVEPDR
jgi:predicted transcriptional regulator of viral defense system